jgi:hypothetical protein
MIKLLCILVCKQPCIDCLNNDPSLIKFYYKASENENLEIVKYLTEKGAKLVDKNEEKGKLHSSIYFFKFFINFFLKHVKKKKHLSVSKTC